MTKIYLKPNFSLVRLEALSGPKCSIYSLLPEDSEDTLFEQFIEEYDSEHATALDSLAYQLEAIAHKTGARENLFRFEGSAMGEWAHALRDEEGKLRLYCLRYGSCLIVLGGGGPKNVKTWQEDPKLTKEVRKMIALADAIEGKRANGELSFSPDGFDFEGDLNFTNGDHD